MPENSCNYCYEWHRAGDPPLVEQNGHSYHSRCLYEHNNLRALSILERMGFTLAQVLACYHDPALMKVLEKRGFTEAEINTVMLGLRPPRS